MVDPCEKQSCMGLQLTQLFTTLNQNIFNGIAGNQFITVSKAMISIFPPLSKHLNPLRNMKNGSILLSAPPGRDNHRLGI
jgi:hypothetical protein